MGSISSCKLWTFQQVTIHYQSIIIRHFFLRRRKEKKKLKKKPSCSCLGPVYSTVEKCTGRSGSLAQDMVIWGKGWSVGEDEKTVKYFTQVGVLRRSSVLSEALRLPKKPNLQKTPLLKSVCHADIHVIFSSMYNVLHRRTLGYSVNHHWTRVLLSANQNSEFPYNSWPVDFSTGPW